MAKKMTEDPDQPTDDPTSDQPADETSPSKAVNKFNDYLEDPLENELAQAAGAVTVGCLTYEDGKSGTSIGLLRLERSQEIRTEYRDIQNCISTTLAAHAANTTGRVAGYVENEAALSGKLTTALEAIKSVKGQMSEVRTLVCKLEDAVKDSCNSEQCKALDKGLPMANGAKGLKRFKAEVTAIGDTTRDLCERADGTFDVGVKYAGIQASINVSCLSEDVIQLQADADALVTDVADNGSSLDAKIVEQQTALDTEITGLGAALSQRLYNDRYHAALEDLNTRLTGIADEDCTAYDEAGERSRLQDICTEVMETLHSSDPPCGEGEGGNNKFNLQEQPSC